MYYKTTVKRVFQVTGLKSEVKFDLGGCLEAAMASEVMKIAFSRNMHIEFKFNFEVKSFP